MIDTKERIIDPETVSAEKWLTPDKFICKGYVYRINPNATITQIGKVGRETPKTKKEN